VFLDDDTSLCKLKVDLPDRPGSLHEIMKVLGEESLNVIAGYTNVLVYYERMTSDLVVDMRRSKARTCEELHKSLGEKISSLGPQFSLVGVSSVTF
jgi:hypothetical protein